MLLPERRHCGFNDDNDTGQRSLIGIFLHYLSALSFESQIGLIKTPLGRKVFMSGMFTKLRLDFSMAMFKYHAESSTDLCENLPSAFCSTARYTDSKWVGSSTCTVFDRTT